MSVSSLQRHIKFGLIVCIALMNSSCAKLTYHRTALGKFEGSLDVRWVKPDLFIYIPSPDNPLRFTASDKRTIKPGKMYSDGGSIPRLFWSVPGFSPWGYAPAYIVHDWLFEAHHCGIAEYEEVTFQQSASLLAEGIKTLMETNIAPKDETTLWAIYSAVSSPLAESIWNKTDSCKTVTAASPLGEAEEPGELLLRIDMKDGALH